MKTATTTIRETPEGWTEDETGRRWNTAVEAERAIRASAPEGILVVEWIYATRVGEIVVRFLVEG